MDINFHYFAVKRIAAVAGFEEEEAQLIAEYSQFVDEYTDNKTYSFDLNDVPEYARSLLDKKRCFQAVQTGFVSKFDYVKLMSKENQKNYLIPFHFLPRICHSDQEIRESYKVVHCTRGDGCTISNLLDEEAGECRKCGVGTSERRRSLISIGVLLHVFADTYAHEHFNGFEGNVNDANLSEAFTKGGADVKDKMGSSKILPDIGHGRVGVAPDVTCVKFKVRQGKEEWERENWSHFMDCATEILKFLTYACYGGIPTENQVENMKESLEEGFDFRPDDYSNPDIKQLEEYWEDTATAIPYTTFHYDKAEIWRRMTPVPMNLRELGLSEEEYYNICQNDEETELSEKLLAATYRVDYEDFFMYNCIANKVRRIIKKYLPA